MSDPGSLMTIRLNYALGIAAIASTLLLISFANSCANLCKKSPRNKATSSPTDYVQIDQTRYEIFGTTPPSPAFNNTEDLQTKEPEPELKKIDEVLQNDDCSTSTPSPQTPTTPDTNNEESFLTASTPPKTPTTPDAKIESQNSPPSTPRSKAGTMMADAIVSNDEIDYSRIAFTYLLACKLGFGEINLAAKNFRGKYQHLFAKYLKIESEELSDIAEEANERISVLGNIHKRETNLDKDIKRLELNDTLENGSSLIEKKTEKLGEISTEYNEILNSFIDWYVSAAKKLNIDQILVGLACYINGIQFLGITNNGDSQYYHINKQFERIIISKIVDRFLKNKTNDLNKIVERWNAEINKEEVDKQYILTEVQNEDKDALLKQIDEMLIPEKNQIISNDSKLTDI